MTDPHLVPHAEFFDRAAVPPEIIGLLDEWPEIDPCTEWLVRTALSARSLRQLRLVWDLRAGERGGR